MGLTLAWKLALVMIAVQPSTMICYYAKKTVLANVSRDLAKAQHQSAQIAIEDVYKLQPQDGNLIWMLIEGSSALRARASGTTEERKEDVVGSRDHHRVVTLPLIFIMGTRLLVCWKAGTIWGDLSS